MIITCLNTGVWNGTVPSCVCCRQQGLNVVPQLLVILHCPTFSFSTVTCQPLSVSSPLRINTTSVTEGTIVGFSCEAGYQLRGNDHWHCESSGHWSSAQLPTCEEGLIPLSGF